MSYIQIQDKLRKPILYDSKLQNIKTPNTIHNEGARQYNEALQFLQLISKL